MLRSRHLGKFASRLSSRYVSADQQSPLVTSSSLSLTLFDKPKRSHPKFVKKENFSFKLKHYPFANFSSQCRLFFTMSASENEVHGAVKEVFDYKLTPEEMLFEVDELIKTSRRAYDEIAAVKDGDINFNSIVKTIANIQMKHEASSSVFELGNKVCVEKTLRDACTEANQRLSVFNVETSMRKDLFDRLVYFDKNNMEELDPETKRFVEHLIILGRRNGLHLSQEVQDELKAIKTKISNLGIKFLSNLNEVTTFIEFDDESLVGLPEDFINNLEKTESGKRKVTLKYPHALPVLRKARNPKTRQIMAKAFNSQCIEENTKLLEEQVELRHQQAQLLGHPTHSSYVTEMKMAKTAENVKEFLTDLAEKLKPLWEEEKETLLQYKKEECDKYGYEFDGQINTFDTMYYTNLFEERKFSVDQEKLREYFPLNVVTEGLFNIYQELLNLKFSEITNAKVWHPDVKMFSVRDADSNGLLGYFYLDLFPREGKYGHACISPLRPNVKAKQVSLCAMLANFTKPSEEKPALLDHDEVTTFFHEFGHVMHHVCAFPNYSMFGIDGVETDFIEAPSQMLENWCWQKEALQRMSAHYKDGSPLPDELIDQLIQSKNACAGYKSLRQIVLAMFDQGLHTSSKADTKALFKEMSEKYLQISPQEGTNFAAHFSHLASSYDAQYYGYMWSEVFSMDMFASRFKPQGIMNKDVGKGYREKILQNGGTKDAVDMLKDFLGREPNQDAFLEDKGLKVL